MNQNEIMMKQRSKILYFLMFLSILGGLSFAFSAWSMAESPKKHYIQDIIPKLCSDQNCQKQMEIELLENTGFFNRGEEALKRLGLKIIKNKGFDTPSDDVLMSLAFVVAPNHIPSYSVDNGAQMEFILSNPKYPQCRALAFKAFPYWKPQDQQTDKEKFALANVNQNEIFWHDIVTMNWKYLTENPSTFCAQMYKNHQITK